MQHFISLTLEGIATGSLYGLMGLSLVFGFRSSNVINFALGDVATSVVFFALFAIRFMPMWAAVLVSLVFAFALGVFVEVSVVKTLRVKTHAALVMIFFGLMAVINNVLGWFFGYDPKPFPSLVPAGAIDFHGVVVSYDSIGKMVCVLVVSIAIYLLFKHTLIGLAFQAVAQDEEAAKLKGIRTSAVISISWGLSAVLGGISGLLIAHSTSVYPGAIDLVTLFAMTAAVIGGLQSSFGALVGGVIVGVVENVASSIPGIGSSLRPVAVFAVLVVFLFFKPRGLFGRVEPRRI